MAEGERFELPDLPVCGFQDRRLKPLGHPSTAKHFVTPAKGVVNLTGRETKI
jgi:hypothetical protein